MRTSIRRFVSAAVALAVVGVVPLARPPAALASNVFCGTDASYVPWDTSADAPARDVASETGMRVVLYTPSATTVTALVDFITADSAYQAAVAGRVHPPANGGDAATDPVLVTFPKPLDVQYAYVDSYAVDGAALTSCPTFVNQVNLLGRTLRGHSALPSLHPVGDRPVLPSRYSTAQAELLQPLPALSCGAMYTPARFSHTDWMDDSNLDADFASYGANEYMPFAGSGPRGPGASASPAVVAIALDSDGKAVMEAIVHSSGNHDADGQALDAARGGTYQPAQFLCTPVVSIIFVQHAAP